MMCVSYLFSTNENRLCPTLQSYYFLVKCFHVSSVSLALKLSDDGFPFIILVCTGHHQHCIFFGFAPKDLAPNLWTLCIFLVVAKFKVKPGSNCLLTTMACSIARMILSHVKGVDCYCHLMVFASSFFQEPSYQWLLLSHHQWIVQPWWSLQ